MVFQWIQGVVQDVAPNSDKYDRRFGVGLILFAGGLSYFAPGAAIPIIAAISAFGVIYQLRHSGDQNPTIVRHSFHENGDQIEYGFKNFGPRSARYLQYIVRVEETGKEISKGPRTYPMHMEEGDFIDLFHDSPNGSDSLGELIEEVSDDSFIGFYYSYESHNGVRVPREMKGEMDRVDQDVRDELYPWDEEQRIKVENVREACL